MASIVTAGTTVVVTKILFIVTLVLALACCGTSAPTLAPKTTAAAPAPENNGCLMALSNMSACLTYVEDGSKLSKPDKGCCPELAGLVDSNPICLCELLGKPDSIGIKIDLNKALKLPSVCGVTTPPVSTCSAVGVPVSLPPSMSEGPSIAPGASSPSNTDAANPASSPNSASSPAGGLGPSSENTAASPSSQNKNGVSAIQASALANFFFGLFTLFVSVFF